MDLIEFRWWAAIWHRFYKMFVPLSQWEHTSFQPYEQGSLLIVSEKFHDTSLD